MKQPTPLNQISKEWKPLWAIYNIIIALVTTVSLIFLGFFSWDTLSMAALLRFLLIQFTAANICFCAGPALDFCLGRLGWRFRDTIFLLGTFIACGLAFFSVSGPFCPYDPFDNRAFNRSVWLAQANSPNPKNPRARMVSDIERHYIKPGISQQQVIELLGKPDFNKQQENVYGYILGAWSAFGVDYNWLVVHFDSNSLVTETDVISD
jgi:hypothetical protein